MDENLPMDLGQPDGVAPEPTVQAPPQGGDTIPDYVEIKNRDDSWEVEREPFQKLADSMGMDVDRLKTALQIGIDGNRLYERLNDEQERLRAAWQELSEIRAQAQRPATPQYPGPGTQPQQYQAPLQRPPAQDITGNVLWMAERLDRLAPLMDRLPAIEEALTETRNQFQSSQERRDIAEERTHSLQAYQDVSQEWKKNGWGDLPSSEKLQQFLRRMPISDDVDSTWHEIWDAAGWALAGKEVARRQRRQAVMDNQRPTARIMVPGNNASPQTRPPAMSSSGDMNEEDMKAAEAALGSMTLGQVMEGQRRLG